MDSANIVIPFDFPFAILEKQHNPDPKSKVAYAVADGQYTYGPLSLFQYHNDEKYSKTMRDEVLPAPLPCREFYIVGPGESIDDAIEIIDSRRGRLYVKEIGQEYEEVQIRGLLQEMIECKNEIRSIKSIVTSEECNTPRSSPNVNRSLNVSFKSAYGDASAVTPIRNKKQIQSSIAPRSVSNIAKKNVNTPPRSQSVTTTRILLKNVKSSGYGQQSPLAKQSLSTSVTLGRSFRK